MGLTAKSRASVALQATTALDVSTALDVVKQAAEQAKGGGASLLTTGIANVGAKVHVEREQPDGLSLSITSGKRVVELCTFSAQATTEDGKTKLKIGGLETYKTSQPRLFYLIPSGPKMILGYDLYKRFLSAVEAGLTSQDPSASSAISQPAAA